MSKLNTLTVQDSLWIHLQLTKAPTSWDYARLEEAVFYQYSYGSSTDLVGQAARFLTGFVKQKPFPAGNEACAFVGVLAFLESNGQGLHLGAAEALDWVRGVWSDPNSAREAIEARLEAHESHLSHGVPDTRGIVMGVLARYGDVCSELLRTGHRAALV